MSFEVIRDAPAAETPRPAQPQNPPKSESGLPTLHWHGGATVEPPRWLVKDLVPQTGAGLLAGMWGTGKTFVALDLALAVMWGVQFAGRRMKRSGGVLFVAAEAAGDIPIRLSALVETKAGGGQGDMLNGAGSHLPFCWVDRCIPLVNKASLNELTALSRQAAAEMWKRHEADLVLIVVDTVAAAACFDDENDAAQAQRAMNVLHGLARATGTAVIGLDHYGKDGQRGTRGSSAKEASADFVLALLGDKEEDGAVSDKRLVVRKLRSGATGQPTPFRLKVIGMGADEDGDPIASCVVEWGEAGSWARPEKPRRESASARMMVQALESIGGLPASRDKVREAFASVYPEDKSDEARRGAMHRAIRELGIVEAAGVLGWRDEPV